MDCSNCAAPLAGKSNICRYCGTLNDADLRTLEHHGGQAAPSDRDCPRCDRAMQSITISAGDSFELERCETCLGIFFDPGELDSLIDKSVSHVQRIDNERLAILVDEEWQAHRSTVAYVKCPVCGVLMNRKNYGSRSGIVVDRCRNHGVWLDGGELSQLLKWSKAGGQLHDRKRQEEDLELEERKERAAKRTKLNAQAVERGRYMGGGIGYGSSLPGLVRIIFDLLI